MINFNKPSSYYHHFRKPHMVPDMAKTHDIRYIRGDPRPAALRRVDLWGQAPSKVSPAAGKILNLLDPFMSNM